MPNPTPSTLTWTSITDFRPGIFSASGLVSTGATKAPKGAADPSNTFRCTSNQAGALVPLPGNPKIYALDTPNGSQPTQGYWPTFIQAQPGFTNTGGPTNDQVVYGVEYLTGTTRRFRLERWKGFKVGTPNQLLFSYDSTATDNTVNHRYGSTTFMSRATPTSPFTAPGVPYVGFEYGADAPLVGGAPIFGAFPNPSTPASLTPFTNAGRARVYGHQGRYVTIADASFSNGDETVIATENISFTDPVNSWPLPAAYPQNQVFVQEWPTGIQVAGSISLGELFLIKGKGGGAYVTGDLANPTVTRLPGVAAGEEQSPASTSIGLVYIGVNSGAWAWNGGNTSRHISPQLDDTAFYSSVSNNYFFSNKFALDTLDRFIFCSNNYIYNIDTQSWWRLDNPATFTIQWWSGSFGIMYGVLDSYTQSNPNALYTFLPNVAASSYVWQCHPIPVTIDRMQDVTEVVLLVQGNGTVAVTVTGAPTSQATNNTVTFSFNSTTQPVRVRSTIFAQGYSVIVNMVSTGVGTGPAPMIYEVHLGSIESTKAGVSP